MLNNSLQRIHFFVFFDFLLCLFRIVVVVVVVLLCCCCYDFLGENLWY